MAHRSLASRLAALAAVLLPLPATAQSIDGYYAGRLRCDAIPAKSVAALDVAFSVTLTRGNATYRRAIHSPDGKLHITDETGEGKVAADGTVSLSGRAAFMSWHYDASYAGTVSGGSLKLLGRQHWEFGDGTTFDRPCTAIVTRG